MREQAPNGKKNTDAIAFAAGRVVGRMEAQANVDQAQQSPPPPYIGDLKLADVLMEFARFTEAVHEQVSMRLHQTGRELERTEVPLSALSEVGTRRIGPPRNAIGDYVCHMIRDHYMNTYSEEERHAVYRWEKEGMHGPCPVTGFYGEEDEQP